MSSIFSFAAVWVLLWVLMLAVCSYAYLRGGKAERAGSILLVGTSVLTALVEGAMLTLLHNVDQSAFLLVRLVSGGVTALGFLVLAVAFAHLWLGAAMLLQAAIFALQASYFVLHRPHDGLYATGNNVAFTGILLALALGAWGAGRRRNSQVSDPSRTNAQPA